MSACSHPLTDVKAKDERAFSPCWQFRMTLESNQSAWRKVGSSPLHEADEPRSLNSFTVTTQHFAPCPPVKTVLLMLSSPLLTAYSTGTKMTIYLIIPNSSPPTHRDIYTVQFLYFGTLVFTLDLACCVSV